jgi:hypothetical protein
MCWSRDLSLLPASQRTQSLNCDFEKAGTANPEGERPTGALETNEKGPHDLENY